MNAWARLLLLGVTTLGCARIYQPIQVLPAPGTPPAGIVSGSVASQPWGDNSRYESRALEQHFQVLVVQVSNQSPESVTLQPVAVTPPPTAYPASVLLGKVRQRAGAYLLYPIVPGLLIPGANPRGSYGPSDQAVFSVFAAVGLAIGLPNFIVATRSNARLGRFLEAEAWQPGTLAPGQVRHGLVYVHRPNRRAPLELRVPYRDGTGEHQLVLQLPGEGRF